MIVMLNRYRYYSARGVLREDTSSTVMEGENREFSAMSKTVGLPVGIGAELVLNGQIGLTGVQVPTKKEIYEPVLAKLADHGLKFERTRVEYPKGTSHQQITF